jgi:hypothetical protein
MKHKMRISKKIQCLVCGDWKITIAKVPSHRCCNSKMRIVEWIM